MGSTMASVGERTLRSTRRTKASKARFYESIERLSPTGSSKNDYRGYDTFRRPERSISTSSYLRD